MMQTGTKTLLRSIPSMDELLNADWAPEFLGALGREQVKSVIAGVLDDLRREILDGEPPTAPAASIAAERAAALLRAKSSSTLKPVVNATGVVLHTNLGRAPLAGEALAAAGAVSGAYSTLEYSPEKGGRETRNAHVEWALCRLTGAEAALVVNNNAAAVLLALSATARGREVIVSAGELVEIGDSFRIPEILSFSGAELRLAGCTNSTRIEDYRAAITENTAVLLKVHPSNYRIEGFVRAPSRKELAELAASRGLILMEDLGSGLLCPLAAAFARKEHQVMDSIRAGCGIVTFSGDKLLGGPQIGVIAGTKPLLDRMKRHQLLRALRVDKMTLAAFDATLRLYLSGRQRDIPVVRMIETDKAVLLEKARRLSRILKRVAAASGVAGITVSVVETEDAAGGGTFPADTLPGYGVSLRSASGGGGAEALAAALRAAPVPVIAAIRDDSVVLHTRALLEGDEKRIASALEFCLDRGMI